MYLYEVFQKRNLNRIKTAIETYHCDLFCFYRTPNIFYYCCPLNVLQCLTMLFLATDKPPLKGFNGCPLNKFARTMYKFHYKWLY